MAKGVVECRALHPYRQERDGKIVEHPRGTVVAVAPADLVQDQARRYRLLKPLSEERAEEEAERLRIEALAAQGIVEMHDRTAEMILGFMQATRVRDGKRLSLDEAWKQLTGEPLGLE